MTFLVPEPAAVQSRDTPLVRSVESHAFEALWRALPREGLPMPYRDAFRPSQAIAFLRDILISDMMEPERGPRIRYCGERLHALTQRNLAGDYLLDMLAPQHHAGVHASAKMMVERPCGLWQVSPLHLKRYAINLEITVFPMQTRDGCVQFLNLLRPLDGVDVKALDTPRGVAIDTAVAFHFIDIGAGAPAWEMPVAV